MKATLRLSQSILGWILVRSRQDDDGLPILDLLYGSEWEKMKSSDRAFLRGKPVADALAHVKDVCQQLNLGLSICGKSDCPTLRIWTRPETPSLAPEIIEDVSVDLKWALWSREQCHWTEYAPGAWGRMAGAFNGTHPPVRIVTAPRKEIRYGTVTVRKGRAEGTFTCEWDSVVALADTLGTVNDDAFIETIPYNNNGEPGTSREFSVQSRTFRQLMTRIDKEESALLETDHQSWREIQSMYQQPTTLKRNPNSAV